MSGAPRYIDPSGRRDALVTPEAVALDLPIADLGTRALSSLIDLTVIFTASYFVAALGAVAIGVGLEASGGPEWVAVVLVLVLSFAAFWGLPVLSETLWKGRTPGKAAMGLRVVTLDGGPVRFRHAAIRWLLALIDFYLLLGVPAIVTAMVTRRSQRLGDVAAGTVVIRDKERVHAHDHPIEWQIPPALRHYAGTLDTGALGAEDYALVRSFLLRSGGLAPAHRTRVAEEVATAVAGRMRHTPPPGTHPEALLLCTAALLQQRQRAPVVAPPRLTDPFAAA